MKNYKSIYKSIYLNQSGATGIAMVITMLSVAMVIAIAASEIVNNGIEVAKTQTHSTRAYYAAEAGAERFMWKIRKEVPALDPGDGTGDGTNQALKFCEDPDAKFCFVDDAGAIQTCQATCDAGDVEQVKVFDKNFYSVDFKYVLASTTITVSGNYIDTWRTIELTY